LFVEFSIIIGFFVDDEEDDDEEEEEEEEEEPHGTIDSKLQDLIAWSNKVLGGHENSLIT
jgi:hypothetical protein